jgi:hypothetical protein
VHSGVSPSGGIYRNPSGMHLSEGLFNNSLNGPVIIFLALPTLEAGPVISESTAYITLRHPLPRG